MIKALIKYRNRQDFYPGLLAFFINPFYIARKGLLKEIKGLAGQINGRIIDVGCGRKPYKELFQFTEYIGIDIENPGHSHENEDIDVYYDGHTFPFENESFNSALCNQVLEHVFNPDHFLSEIHRVLSKDGKLLLTVPFAWDEHEVPFDYARYSSYGLKHLLEKNGFQVLAQAKSNTNFNALTQLVLAYIFKLTRTQNKYLNFGFGLIYTFPINALGGLLSLLLPDNKDFYLDNIILAKKI